MTILNQLVTNCVYIKVPFMITIQSLDITRCERFCDDRFTFLSDGTKGTYLWVCIERNMSNTVMFVLQCVCKHLWIYSHCFSHFHILLFPRLYACTCSHILRLCSPWSQPWQHNCSTASEPTWCWMNIEGNFQTSWFDPVRKWALSMTLILSHNMINESWSGLNRRLVATCMPLNLLPMVIKLLQGKDKSI